MDVRLERAQVSILGPGRAGVDDQSIPSTRLLSGCDERGRGRKEGTETSCLLHRDTRRASRLFDIGARKSFSTLTAGGQDRGILHDGKQLQKAADDTLAAFKSRAGKQTVHGNMRLTANQASASRDKVVPWSCGVSGIENMGLVGLPAADPNGLASGAAGKNST